MAEEELGIVILKDRVLVEKVASKDVGLISVIKDTDSQVLTGSVVKIGSTVEEIEVGTTVLYEKHDALPIEYLGKQYHILREFSIIATI